MTRSAALQEETSPTGVTGTEVLVEWLARCVRDGNTQVTAPLRRSGRGRPPQSVPGMPGDVPPEIAIRVARMFVRYHQAGDFRFSLRLTGYGDIGQALRRLSRADPPGRPWEEAAERAMRSLLTPRRRLPWRELEHALDTMNRARLIPPSWTLLIDDLTEWHMRGDVQPRTTRERWAWSFFNVPTAGSTGRGRNSAE